MIRLFGVAALAGAIMGIAGASHAAPITYTAHLSGPAEFPPNNSPATGFARVDFDIVAHTMNVQATFSGLVAPTSAAHIHGPIPPPPANPVAGVVTMEPS